MHVAYLINHYPAVSHTFIRREIHALEAQGVTVERFALRGWDSTLVDPLDIAELAKTRHTLKDGLGALLRGAAGFALRQPGPFFRAMKQALALSRNGERSWPYHLIYLAHACRIMSWLRGQPVTHLHAHFGTNSAEIALLVKTLGGPGYSFTVHGSEVFDDPKHHALPQKVGMAKAAVGSCAYIAAQMKYHTPHDLWNRINTVHCGLAPESLVGDPAPLPDALTFLSIGRFSPEKGHLVLLAAFAAISKDYPNAKLVLAGDGPMRDELEARIRSLGLGDAVRITGWINSDQVKQEIRAASALVHPSFTEGLPVVIMEAMAEARPVIATYIAGIPELVQEGKTGWLVPAGLVDELATAMTDLAQTPKAEVAQLGHAGLERVRHRHDAAIEAGKLKTIFAADQP